MNAFGNVLNMRRASPDLGAAAVDLRQRRREECLMAQAPLRELLETVLGRGSCMEIRAKGYSMDPFIRDGDVLAVSPLPSGGLQPGDIIAFKLPAADKLAIHRVIGMSADSCLVRGDCCSEPDGYVLKENILGVVSRIERRGRRIRLGMGPEKALIAFLSSKNILWRGAPAVRRHFGSITGR
jgi:signal peptidase I